MTNLADALADLKAEVLNGMAADDVYNDIASEYSINPALLIRKFRESYVTDAAVKAVAVVTDPRAHLVKKINDAIDVQCKRYNVDRGNVHEMTIRGIRYTIICRLTNVRVRNLVGVSHQDGLCYRLNR